MKNTQGTQKDFTTKGEFLYMSFDMGDTKWKMAFSDGNKKRHITIEARDLDQLQEEINKAKCRFSLDDDVKI